MSLTEQMRRYILNANEPPLYKQMRKDLELDHPTALSHFMELFRQGFCKAMSVEGELRIFQDIRNSSLTEASE
jgi:hypothetical protein